MKKKCSKCQTRKDVKHFARDASRRDGYSCYCRDCASVRLKAYVRTPAGKDAMKRASEIRKKKN